MKNNKGFTLVELLATIVILGLLATIAIGSVMYMVELTKENYYKTQEDLIIASAREYFLNNRYELPDNGSSISITTEELARAGYGDETKDHNGEECKIEQPDGEIQDGIKVEVTHDTTTDDYNYSVSWNCPEYKN